MRVFFFVIFLPLAGCLPVLPAGTYTMKSSPKTALVINAGGSFQFILDYQNPYLGSHKYPEQYYFRTDGSWHMKGRTMILNSGNDSLQYDLYRVTLADNAKKDTSTYEFYDIYKDRIPILYVKSNNGKIDETNSSLQYFTHENAKDTLQFYFFGYKPVTIITSGEGQKDYQVFVFPEYRPGWIKDLKFRVKTRGNNKSRVITLNWKSLQEKLKKETNKEYSGPPMF